MAESVYKIIELVGSSEESWEKAAANAVEVAAKTLRDLRIAEVVEQDLHIENGKVTIYRTKVKLSFKVERIDWSMRYSTDKTLRYRGLAGLQNMAQSGVTYSHLF